jgi:hypothetical protein
MDKGLDTASLLYRPHGELLISMQTMKFLTYLLQALSGVDKESAIVRKYVNHGDWPWI